LGTHTLATGTHHPPLVGASPRACPPPGSGAAPDQTKPAPGHKQPSRGAGYCHHLGIPPKACRDIQSVAERKWTGTHSVWRVRCDRRLRQDVRCNLVRRGNRAHHRPLVGASPRACPRPRMGTTPHQTAPPPRPGAALTRGGALSSFGYTLKDVSRHQKGSQTEMERHVFGVTDVAGGWGEVVVAECGWCGRIWPARPDGVGCPHPSDGDTPPATRRGKPPCLPSAGNGHLPGSNGTGPDQDNQSSIVINQ